MAVAIASHSLTEVATTSTVVINKPTGLAVDDLMIAHLVTSNRTISTPSGWTLLDFGQEGTGGATSYLFWKKATSADVSATDYSFTISGSVRSGGAILRITGAPLVNPIFSYATTTDTNDGTPEYNGVNTTANSMIIMFIGTNTAFLSGSGYAMATDNPTWTELYDDADTNVGIVCAYANRLASTPTGTCTFTVSAASPNDCDSVGQVISISISKDVEVLDTVTVTDSELCDISSPITDTVTLTEDYDQEVDRIWTKETKPTTTWTKTPRN